MKQDGLPLLDLEGAPDQALDCEPLEEGRGRDPRVETVGKLHHAVSSDQPLFGIGADLHLIGDTIARLEVGHPVADRLDLADAFRPGDERIPARRRVHALPKIDVDEVEPDREMVESDLARSRLADLDLAPLEHLGPAGLVDLDRVHHHPLRTDTQARASHRGRERGYDYSSGFSMARPDPPPDGSHPLQCGAKPLQSAHTRARGYPAFASLPYELKNLDSRVRGNERGWEVRAIPFLREPQDRGARIRTCSSKPACLHQILPLRVQLLDELELPLALPFLDLPLADKGRVSRLMCLGPHQRLDAILPGEAGKRTRWCSQTRRDRSSVMPT